MVDRKFEPLVKRLMVKYLGELEDDDLIMFVLEHLKDHKSPQKLVDGLEPVRVRYLLRNSPIDQVLVTGFRRGSRRIYCQRLETSHLRKHGVWRGSPNGAHYGRLGVLGRIGQLNVLDPTHRYLYSARNKGAGAL